MGNVAVAITLGRMQHTTNSIQDVESVLEKEFNNPIYEDVSEHTAKLNYHSENSTPDHQFDNPIYGTTSDKITNKITNSTSDVFHDA